MTLKIDPHRRNAHARRIFDGIADNYRGPAQALSMFQYGRWHRFMVSRLRLNPTDLVLDVCTGTGLVALRMASNTGCRVVGIDVSERMIAQGRRNAQARGLAPMIRLVSGRAESLPFADESFDAVVFTYLLRYVGDPRATLKEISRVLRPGGQMASLEFFVPQSPVLRALWLMHTRLVLPSVTRFLSAAWREVGAFLGPSISAFYRRHTLDDLSQMWVGAGMRNVQTEVLSLGGAVATWGQKEAQREN